MQKKITTYFIPLFLLLGSLLSAQTIDSVITDSTSSALVKPDSIEQASLIKAEASNKHATSLDSTWKVLAETNTLYAEKDPKNLFRIEKILFYNYTGFADVFRHRPNFQIYDFFSPGFPRYIGELHLLPHQTSITLEGSSLNDPMSGMYNTGLFSLDGIQAIQKKDPLSLNQSTIYGYDNGINLISPYMNYAEPYTRIMFRQGDFGYTDLDISFAQELGNNLAVYLGGINKIYDTATNSGGENNHGFQYRAGLNYRIRPDLYLHSTYYFDRDKVELNNYSFYNRYRYRDFVQHLNNHFYYVTDPESGERWHLAVNINRVRRRNDSKAALDTFVVTRKSDLYNISLDRNIMLSGITLSAAAGAYQSKVWGVGFPGDLTETGINGSVTADYSLSDTYSVSGKLKTAWLYGNGINYAPHISFKFIKPLVEWTLNTGIDHRFPTRTERSFRYELYTGNDKLDSESISSVTTSFSFYPFEVLDFSAEAGYKTIKNEIIFDGTTFSNNKDRNIAYFSAEGEYRFYKFAIGASGQLSHSDIKISPGKSASAQIRYHDSFLNNALIIDAVGNVHWYDKHNTLFYHPIVERFYWSDDQMDGYYYFSYKIAATVKSAQLYVAMDNPMSSQYQFINGYYELYRRVRFGVNWVLWN